MFTTRPTQRDVSLSACLWALLVTQAAWATEVPKIRDNLFLLEEAYNQEPGVIQHIQTLERAPTGAFAYSFTEEWPVPSDLHQLSLTLQLAGANVFEALALNYRFQAVGVGGAGPVAFSPRISAVFTNGALGGQLNLPLSLELSDALVAHLNAGLTVFQALTVETNAGGALVWLIAPWVNALVEVLHASTGTLEATREHEVIVNPGVRFAIDFPSGLQIVPGLSAPISVLRERPEVSVFAYLSFEHPLWDAGE